MLEGGGVVDEVRPHLAEDGIDLVLIDDVRNPEPQRGLRRDAAQLRGEVVEAAFVVVDEVQLARSEAEYLAHELGANRTSSAGYQHHLVLHRTAAGCVIDLDGLASEEVFEGDVAQRVA